MDYKTEKKVIFAAMSKKNFYLREHIIKFVLRKGYTPMCAFMMYSYFLLDTVDRKYLITANNDLIKRSDELWVFGEISNGVREEIKLADEAPPANASDIFSSRLVGAKSSEAEKSSHSLVSTCPYFSEKEDRLDMPIKYFVCNKKSLNFKRIKSDLAIIEAD